MSDDFDREAEREKLREKYERDKAKREASERMSELLLQGATMTNRHCPECHSPVFTYEGTAFCPTCQREVTEDGELAGEAGAGAESGDAGPTDDAENGEAAAVSADGKTVGESHPESGTAPEADATGEPAGAAESSVDEERTGPRSAGRRQPSKETRPAPTPERRPARVDPPARREERGGERRDLDDAEAALVREITNLTRRAEETRDVGRKRDFFAAAREAAETLETVRRL
jgi:uncharacterized Zn finger protein (UPF0148 family)